MYRVGCRDCKISRDLDKFYSMRPAADRAEALDIANQIKERDAFRAALLVSFLWEHKGHNCTVFSEDDTAISEEFDSLNNEQTGDGIDFWRQQE
jgi:hypothetical protein